VVGVTGDGLLAVGAGVVVGLGLFLLVWFYVGVQRRDPGKPRLFSRGGAIASRLPQRLLVGGIAGLAALVVTRWVVMGVGIGLLAAYWDRIAGGGADERVAISRLEGLATWTESLRDTIAGAIGLEQAIPATAQTAAPVLRPSLNLLVDRLRIREPLPEALLAFAEDIGDPSADTIVAALVLNARLRGPGLRDVLTALAASAREELDMRRRIEASRRSIRRSVRIIIVVVLGVAGLLVVLNRDYVRPYDSLVGQVVLGITALLFLAGLLWLRRLAKPQQLDRFLTVSPRGGGRDAFEEVSM
jgi:Flp pilus assembly protein TadB